MAAAISPWNSTADLRHFGAAAAERGGNFLQFCDGGHPLKGLAKFGYSSERESKQVSEIISLSWLWHISPQNQVIGKRQQLPEIGSCMGAPTMKSTIIIIIIILAILFQFQCEYVLHNFWWCCQIVQSWSLLGCSWSHWWSSFFIYEGFKGIVAGCVVSYGKGLGFRDMTRY